MGRRRSIRAATTLFIIGGASLLLAVVMVGQQPGNAGSAARMAAPIGTVLPAATPARPSPTALGDAAYPVVMAPETAVVEAIRQARHPSPIGHLVGEPTEIRGRVMTYEEFHWLVEGRPLELDERGLDRRQERVWVIALRGTIDPTCGSCSPHSPQPTYRQLLMQLDARTGAQGEMALFPTTHELDVTSLPILARPTGPVPPPAPTATPGPPAIPAPTRPAAPLPAPMPTPAP